MKIFARMPFKSIAAGAAVALFASSAAYATCQQDCAAYAQTEARKVRANVYYQVYQSCIHSPGANDYSCNQSATMTSENAYNSAYNGIYSNCTATNCGG